MSPQCPGRCGAQFLRNTAPCAWRADGYIGQKVTFIKNSSIGISTYPVQEKNNFAY